MKVGEPHQDVLIDLDVSFLRHSLTPHHLNQVLIPFHHLGMGIRVEVEVGDVVGFQLIYIEMVGTYKVLHLPHIEEVFGDVLLFELLTDEHIG